jgi:hypothetical protein
VRHNNYLLILFTFLETKNGRTNNNKKITWSSEETRENRKEQKLEHDDYLVLYFETV